MSYYKDRLRKEMESLATKLEKLNYFIDNDYTGIRIQPEEKLLLTDQAIVMHEYLVILNKRLGLTHD